MNTTGEGGAEPERDVALLDRWCAGDAAAGQALFRRYFDNVFRFFVTKCPREDAEELTQATFLACTTARDRFRREATFRAYLFSIARNVLHRRLRERYRHDPKVVLELDRTSIAQIITTPRTRIGRQQEHARLVAVLQELPVESQTLLELHYREELDADQLAEVFEVTNQVVRTRLSRARTLLREKLERRAKMEAR